MDIQTQYWQKMGKHSQFPQCCIDWFCSEWFYAGRTFHQFYTERIRTLDKIGLYKFQPGYVPCPVCLDTNRQVKIHRCGRECRELIRQYKNENYR